MMKNPERKDPKRIDNQWFADALKPEKIILLRLRYQIRRYNELYSGYGSSPLIAEWLDASPYREEEVAGIQAWGGGNT